MTTLVESLEAKLAKVHEERQRLGQQEAHLQAALIRAHKGVNEKIITETLERLGVQLEEAAR
jgi:hypothetical protein